MKEDDKKRILDFLKEKGKSPTGKISTLLSISFYKTQELLKELNEEDKKIKKSEIGKGTYWELI